MPHSSPTRSFTSFSAATQELKNARVFGGIHYRNSCNVGQNVGDMIGAYTLGNALLREPARLVDDE
jgi:hypothetical protein